MSRRAQEDARQIELLDKAWKESGRVYGYRKLHDDLLDQGETSCANRERIRRKTYRTRAWQGWPESRPRSAIGAGRDLMAASRRSWSTTPWPDSSMLMRRTRRG